jgi:hypothetical protein
VSDLTPVDPSLPVAPTGGGIDMPEGLEDLSTSDLSTPRITIDHKECVFEDSQSGQKFPSLDNAIILGLVKQRVLWPASIGESDQPLCKSFDAKVGNANPGSFPWEAANFDPNEFPKTDGDFPRIMLPCSQCQLKEWNSHPKQDNPWCTLQNTLILLINESGVLVPALFSVQRSGLKPCTTYLSTFIRSNKPAFTSYTTISLQPAKRGDNTYAVPKFVKGSATEEKWYPYFAQQYREIKRFITNAPETDDVLDSDLTGGVGSSEASSAAPATGPTAVPTAPPAVPESASGGTSNEENNGSDSPDPISTPAGITGSGAVPVAAGESAQGASEADDDDDLPF